MKRGSLLFFCPLLIFAFIQTTLLVADTDTVILESRIIESFDDPDAQQWMVIGSKFVKQDFPKMAYANAWPNALFGSNRENQDLKVLAIQAAFDRMGYNSLEIFPVEEVEGELVPSPITLPGKVKSIDLWVWGSNYDYYMDLHVSDYTGIIHVLRLGTIKYTGWKNLTVDIPHYIPQSGGHLSEGGYIRNIRLEKLVLWTKPTEPVSGFNLYLDQIKVLTDTFVSRFDGDDLADPEKVNEIFSSSAGRQ